MHSICSQGLAWIEVKAHEPFDLYSSQWLGNPGHFKGMPLTLAELTATVSTALWSYTLLETLNLLQYSRFMVMTLLYAA